MGSKQVFCFWYLRLFSSANRLSRMVARRFVGGARTAVDLCGQPHLLLDQALLYDHRFQFDLVRRSVGHVKGLQLLQSLHFLLFYPRHLFILALRIFDHHQGGFIFVRGRRLRFSSIEQIILVVSHNVGVLMVIWYVNSRLREENLVLLVFFLIKTRKVIIL